MLREKLYNCFYLLHHTRKYAWLLKSTEWKLKIPSTTFSTRHLFLHLLYTCWYNLFMIIYYWSVIIHDTLRKMLIYFSIQEVTTNYIPKTINWTLQPLEKWHSDLPSQFQHEIHSIGCYNHTTSCPTVL